VMSVRIDGRARHGSTALTTGAVPLRREEDGELPGQNRERKKACRGENVSRLRRSTSLYIWYPGLTHWANF